MQYLRCHQDGTILVVVEAERAKFAVCPQCGAGAPLEGVAKQGAGLIAGFITADQLENLRKDLKMAKVRR